MTYKDHLIEHLSDRALYTGDHEKDAIHYIIDLEIALGNLESTQKRLKKIHETIDTNTNF